MHRRKSAELWLQGLSSHTVHVIALISVTLYKHELSRMGTLPVLLLLCPWACWFSGQVHGFTIWNLISILKALSEVI